MKIKLLILTLFINLLSFNVQAQEVEPFFKNFNIVATICNKLIEKYFVNDATIEKKRLKDMAIKLNGNINQIISAKKDLVRELRGDDFARGNYPKAIGKIRIKLEKLDSTLKEYDDLIATFGLNAQDLQAAIHDDISEKNAALAKAITESRKTNANKQAVIKYIDNGIVRLTASKESLKRIIQ